MSCIRKLNISMLLIKAESALAWGTLHWDSQYRGVGFARRGKSTMEKLLKTLQRGGFRAVSKVIIA
ncbi:hypothetical protein J4731_07645 [Providencia rettgeri]|nr:hypothetical protein [Providencia rettgeri]